MEFSKVWSAVLYNASESVAIQTYFIWYNGPKWAAPEVVQERFRSFQFL